MYILSTVKTENTCTPARLEALVQIHQPLSFVPQDSKPKLLRKRLCSQSIVKRSAVLFFVSTRPTDRRFSRIHCCIAKHRISIWVSPLGQLRCRMCLVESESISTPTVKMFREKIGCAVLRVHSTDG